MKYTENQVKLIDPYHDMLLGVDLSYNDFTELWNN